MTDASQTPPTNGSAPHDPHLDRLAQLHRMSRTAGVGSAEYAAVNTLAVISAVLGLASALSLMHPIFILVTGLPGLIIASVAIVQIRGSNGTQTGLPLAILGLVACLAFAGGKGFKELQHDRLVKSDQQAIETLIGDFGQRLSKEDYAGAYSLLDQSFQSRVKLKDFQSTIAFLRQRYGAITLLKPSKYFDWDQDPEDASYRLSRNQALSNLDTMPRIAVVYRFNGKRWAIYNLPEWFADQPQQQQQQQPQPGPPPGPSGPPLPAGPAGPPSPTGP